MSQQPAFAKPDRARRRLKVLLTGAQKTGKTRAALTFPRPALVDTEGGWEFIDDLTPDAVAQTQDLDACHSLIAAVRADGGASYDSLVLDSVTVLYDVATYRLRRDKGAKFGYAEHALVNSHMKALYNALTQLPVHVVVIAREDDVYVSEAGTLKKAGRGVDADKSILYAFDFIIQMSATYSGTVLFSRGDALPKGHVLPQVTFTALDAALRPDDLRNVQAARAFFAHWRDQGRADADILALLKVDKISQWTAGRAAADTLLARQSQPAEPPDSFEQI